METVSAYLPERLVGMLESTAGHIADSAECEEILSTAFAVADVAWERWLSRRPQSDNRHEHEFVVFDNMTRIAESESLSLPEKRIATAFCFLHDTCFIPRIMEADVLKLRLSGAGQEADELERKRIGQRAAHMRGGAKNTAEALEGLLESEDIERCVGLVAKHDCWKLGEPWPRGEDRLAVVCLEADALWPLHPLGVLAALELSNANGNSRDVASPAEWLAQVKESLDTLLEYRSNWSGLSAEHFVDNESIFRTAEGHRLFSVWKRHWLGDR